MSGQVEPISITLLVGLPGSGKRELADTLKAGLDNVVIINEPRHFSDLTRYPGKDLIIADSYLCLKEVQQNAAEVIKILWPGTEPTWIFFQNNLGKCRLNATGRGSVALAEYLSARYSIPPKYQGTLVSVVSKWDPEANESTRWRGTPRAGNDDNFVGPRPLANFTI